MTGAYTVHLNMQEYLWDGIKRDRVVWLGDMHPEVSTIMAVFGYNEVVDKSINLACEQFPLPQWLNGMSAYSMWYLIIQYEWYMHNGNLDYLRKHRGYITGLIDRIDGCVDEEGNENLAKSRFLDWPSTPNEAGVEAGYRALLGWALDDGAKLCDLLDEKGHAAKCNAIAGRLKKQIKQPNRLKQAAALMAVAGLMEPERACDEIISVGGARDFPLFMAIICCRHWQRPANINRRWISSVCIGEECLTWEPLPFGRILIWTGAVMPHGWMILYLRGRMIFMVISGTIAIRDSGIVSVMDGLRDLLPG